MYVSAIHILWGRLSSPLLFCVSLLSKVITGALHFVNFELLTRLLIRIACVDQAQFEIFRRFVFLLQQCLSRKKGNSWRVKYMTLYNYR